MIQVYKKNELFIIENTVTDIIYPNLTREEALVLLKKFDRDEPEDRCDFAIKEDNISFEYASLDDKDKTIADLDAKLAEKEKEIENLKHFKVTIGTMETNQVDISSTTYIDQDKISFAIAELEKVKSVINTSVRDDHIIWDFDIKAHIDNQIKQLKEKDNG